MSRRNHERRCAGCRMHAALCVCGLIPRIETRTRLVLLVHRDEARKPTNTGQLAARALARSSVVVIGDRERKLPTEWFAADETPMLLFPDEHARPIAELADAERPVLVVPDGTWRQAQKMGARIEALRDVPRVRLPEGPPTRYRLRAEPKDGGLATLEAIARALAVLEGAHGAAVEQQLSAPFHAMVERTLWLRGALRDDEVTSGLPPAARLGVRG